MPLLLGFFFAPLSLVNRHIVLDACVALKTSKPLRIDCNMMYSLSFRIVTILGFWRPSEWDSGLARFVYNCFTVCMWMLIFSLTVSMLMDVVINVRNVDEFIENCFLLLTWINACCKMTYILLYRNEIINLLKILVDDHCRARDVGEQEIDNKFFEKTRYV